MNKKSLVKKIVDQLNGDLAVFYKAARASRAEATHEQNKAENKYDTRGLEASYLARGQSRQAAELETAIKEFESLPLREFRSSDPIDLGALVELSGGRERSFYFIGPRAGGTEVVEAEQEVVVITPSSPLGQQLVGKKRGDRIQLPQPGAPREFKIVSVA